MEQFENFEKDQEKSKERRGGVRKGSGRKKKALDLKDVKKKFRDYFTEEEIMELVARAKVQSIDKPEMTKFILEQLFGKAPQPLGGSEELPPINLKWEN